MNQLDFWRGGHQSNRGQKLLCVICNKIQFKRKTKISRLFQVGFDNDTLCYKKNLKNIILKFFELK